MNRRKIVMGGGAVALLGAGAWALDFARIRGPLGAADAFAGGSNPVQLAEAGEIFEDDRVLGSAEAPITIIEFASMTCPHCATFHKNTWPQLKESWIESDKARFVFRHYPLDALALRASALAECFEGKSFFAFVDILFATQSKWARSQDPLGALKGLARQVGMDDATAEACLNDEARMDKIFQKVSDARDNYDINSTPSFVIDGKRVDGINEFGAFDSALKKIAGEV